MASGARDARPQEVDVSANSHVREALGAAVERGLAVHQSAVEAYLRRARQRRPDASLADFVASSERQYLASLVTLGGGAGVTEAVLGMGTAAAGAGGMARGRGTG